MLLVFCRPWTDQSRLENVRGDSTGASGAIVQPLISSLPRTAGAVAGLASFLAGEQAGEISQPLEAWQEGGTTIPHSAPLHVVHGIVPHCCVKVASSAPLPICREDCESAVKRPGHGALGWAAHGFLIGDDPARTPHISLLASASTTAFANRTCATTARCHNIAQKFVSDTRCWERLTGENAAAVAAGRVGIIRPGGPSASLQSPAANSDGERPGLRSGGHIAQIEDRRYMKGLSAERLGTAVLILIGVPARRSGRCHRLELSSQLFPDQMRELQARCLDRPLLSVSVSHVPNMFKLLIACILIGHGQGTGDKRRTLGRVELQGSKPMSDHALSARLSVQRAYPVA